MCQQSKPEQTPDKDPNPSDIGLIKKLVNNYSKLLHERPVLTKSLTSALIAGLGDLISQFISSNHGSRFNWRSTFAFTTFGLIFNGPLTHHFYMLLDQLLPPGTAKSGKYSTIKRVLFDRLILAPPYLLLCFYMLSILEGRSSIEACQKIRETYWTLLKMNWKIWTVFQYININYVEPEYRVLFTNVLSLIWTIYVATFRHKKQSS